MTNKSRRQPLPTLAVALLTVVVSSACGGGGGSGGEPAAPPRVTSIAVTPDAIALEALDATAQLQATARTSNGNSIAAVFNWTSTDTTVATVSSAGLVTARGNGMTTVTVASGSVSQTVSVTVEQRLSRLVTSADTVMLNTLGASSQLEVTPQDANGHRMSADIRWRSSDSSIAIVDTSGIVTAKGHGSATVTATSGAFSATVTVTVSLYPAIVLTPSSSLLDALGSTVLLRAQVLNADVTEAGTTELSVAVPQFHCRPPRDVALTVAVGTNSASYTLALQPDEPTVSVAMGRQQILGAGQEKCLQFSAAPESEAYLIGVQSTRVPTNRSPRNALTPLRLVATTSAPATPQSMLLPSGQRRARNVVPGPATVGFAEASVFHAVTPQLEPAVRELTSQSPPVISEADLDALPELDDTVTLSDCPEELFVHTIGTRALWLVNQNLREFVDRHEGRISDLSDLFDSVIYPAVVDYFGVPDLGGVDRVLMVVCYERVGAHTASGNAIRTDIFVSAATLAHEFTHTVQEDHRTGFRFTDWFAEGQATLGQEVFGFTVTNRHPAQNYGRDVAFSTEYPNPGAWQEPFERLSGYFSGAYEARPHECGWISIGIQPQCGAALEYGVGWSFLRWLTDQYARQYPGGDAQFHREMLLSGQDQLGAIERLLGSPFETLLAQWSAAMYVDDRVPGADPTLQFTSWNFSDVYNDDPDRLIPREIPFEDLQRIARLRDGSTWYLRVSGEDRPSAAIGVENPYHTELPDDIQVWVVRLE